MKFNIIRIAFWFVFLFSILLVQKKDKSKNGKILLFVLSTILLVIFELIPFENAFMTFSSPEDSYKYHNRGTPVITVAGQETSLIVGEKGEEYIYGIAPKADKGWKLGMGYNLKCVYQSVNSTDKNLINVFQYKSTDDYYIVITNLRGENLSIKDSLNSKFVLLEKSKKSGTANDYIYIAYVKSLDNRYVVNIDDAEVALNIG